MYIMQSLFLEEQRRQWRGTDRREEGVGIGPPFTAIIVIVSKSVI